MPSDGHSNSYIIQKEEHIDGSMSRGRGSEAIGASSNGSGCAKDKEYIYINIYIICIVDRYMSLKKRQLSLIGFARGFGEEATETLVAKHLSS